MKLIRGALESLDSTLFSARKDLTLNTMLVSRFLTNFSRNFIPHLRAEYRNLNVNLVPSSVTLKCPVYRLILGLISGLF